MSDARALQFAALRATLESALAQLAALGERPSPNVEPRGDPRTGRVAQYFGGALDSSGAESTPIADALARSFRALNPDWTATKALEAAAAHFPQIAVGVAGLTRRVVS